MKTDISIQKITVASISRSVIDIESWVYSKIPKVSDKLDFELDENELPVFQIESATCNTLITTQRILEKNSGTLKLISFDEIDNVIYGDFKKQINKPELSIFRIVDIYGEHQDFQFETGKASIGLIKSINTILKLRASQ